VIIRRSGVGFVLALLTAWACTDATPTSQDPDQLPVGAETYEVFLPFEMFASDLQTFTGFGSPLVLGNPIVAHQWTGGDGPEGGTLEARTLVRFGPRPDSIFVVPPGADESQPDHDYEIVSGSLTLRFDTTDVAEEDLITVSTWATESRWDRNTVSWSMAVDSLGDRVPWPEAGGGPMRSVASAVWEAVEGDSVAFELDAATLMEWTDREADFRGLVIRSETPESRFRVRDIVLRMQVRPSLNPDTTLTLGPLSRQSTFIHSPQPEANDQVFLVGGTPSWRSTLRLELPQVLDGDEELCQAVPCPLELRDEEILFASLILSTAPPDPQVMRPRSEFPMLARAVLAPDRLPRSPLGRSVQPVARQIAPDLFRSGTEGTVAVPMTAYIRETVRARLTDDVPPPSTIAFLSPSEPSGLGVAAFHGPGSASPPMLRIIFTISDGVTPP